MLCLLFFVYVMILDKKYSRFKNRSVCRLGARQNRPQGYKLSSTEHEIYPENTTSEIHKARNFLICRQFSFYEQLKFRAQLG